MDSTDKNKPIEILLVEDDPADIDLMQEALEESKLGNNLHVVVDGEEAMAFLRKEGKYAQKPRPALILLDLKLPKKNGREVLADIKSSDDLKSIPVVIISSSKGEEDIAKSYHLGANCYITKPVDFNKFVEIVQSLEEFWFTIVKLPQG